MKAGISTIQILTLSNIKGVGIKSIQKVGNYLFDCGKIIENMSEFANLLSVLKIKKKNSSTKGTSLITVEDLEEAENIAIKIKQHRKRRYWNNVLL